MNHFEHLTCNYSAALFVIKLRASVKSCYIDDLMAVAHRDICHRFSHYILFLIYRMWLINIFQKVAKWVKAFNYIIQ
jgi:hypothetical protein